MRTEAQDGQYPVGDAGGQPSIFFRLFRRVLPLRGWVIALSLVFGIVGTMVYGGLRRDLFPDLTLPTLQLLIQSPGRSAPEIELAVAQPVEQAMLGLPGVRRVTSTLQPGIAQIVIAFESASDPWRARQLVGEKLATLVGAFPEGTEAPLVTSAAGRLQEIQELVLEGPAIDPMTLRDQAVRVLVPRLQSVSGVARIELLGGAERTVEISLVAERLRLAGASLAQVLEALEGSEQDSGAGLLEVRDKMWLVSVATLAATNEELRRIPVHTAHGLVTLGDLAEVRDAPGFRLGLARYGGFEAVSMRVVKQPGAETLSTARQVRALLPELQSALPAGMKLELFYDQGELVDRALSGVTTALLIGSGFVALVLVLLLGSLRGALVVLAVLPLSTVGAAIPLMLLGHGLNAMTLGGLAIAVGILVDAGVIMVENLVHRLEAHPREAGEPTSRRRILSAAAAEVAVPIVTAVAVILAVFVPLLALPGVAGRLYAPLAVAVASAMTISLALSFTLVPVLVDRFLPPGTALAEPRFVAWIKRIYRPGLDWALRHGLAVQVVALLVALPSFWLATRLDTQFLPELDEGALMVQTLLPSDVSVAAVDEANVGFEAGLVELPGVRSVYRRTGRGEITEDPMPHSISDILVVLEPGTDSEALGVEIEELGEAAPFGVEVTTPMGMRIAEGIGGSPADIEVELYAADLEPLRAREAEIRRELAELPGVVSVIPDSGTALPAWRIVPDEDALRRLDVPRTLLVETARAALQGIPPGAALRGDPTHRSHRAVSQRRPADWRRARAPAADRGRGPGHRAGAGRAGGGEHLARFAAAQERAAPARISDPDRGRPRRYGRPDRSAARGVGAARGHDRGSGWPDRRGARHAAEAARRFVDRAGSRFRPAGAGARIRARGGDRVRDLAAGLRRRARGARACRRELERELDRRRDRPLRCRSAEQSRADHPDQGTPGPGIAAPDGRARSLSRSRAAEVDDRRCGDSRAHADALRSGWLGARAPPRRRDGGRSRHLDPLHPPRPAGGVRTFRRWATKVARGLERHCRGVESSAS
jgi:cobalt-zinc-cadmium resistance protein CzcA